jgi:hypothetical protein
MTAERLAIFRPISEALTALLDQQRSGNPATRPARSTPDLRPQPPNPDTAHLIKSKLFPCEMETTKKSGAAALPTAGRWPLVVW